ncbi:hypothetical protein [Nonomuraea dietziae]|uniref:Uncharacterized protein n=1 Tax=Nonomuraea dietziae TaxID=65515 RepID=A0A7W5V5T5_9ACTN|nr:hypothetical protein [Nonomuraea dietziae]MBB3727850.1 hypothetical protein [Nonomuraea dietziae]
MLAFALGLAWLVLSPLCLWILVRGRNPARLGAVLTLVAMEAATVLISQERESLVVVAHDAPAAARRPAAPDCSERAPVPQAARLGRRHEQLRLYWTAAPDECGTAEVLLRRRGRELRVWITEGTPQTRPVPATPTHPVDAPQTGHATPPQAQLQDASRAQAGSASRAQREDASRAQAGRASSIQREGVRTVPVHVEYGTASLALPLHHLPRHTRYVTVDGRSGRRIPLQR